MIKRILSFSILICALYAGYSYSRQHMASPRSAADEPPVATQSDLQDAPPAASTGAETLTRLEGPLEQWMEKVEKAEARATTRREVKFYPSDRIGDSPVGTTTPVLRKTFAMAAAAKFPLEIPPHSASAHLRGNYKSYAQHAGVVVNDELADVEFLVMSDSQYQESARGGPSSAIFSADAAHDQDIIFQFPMTLDQPAKYYLVFRSAPGSASKKVVKADFRVDF
ncbi:MAG TPA: hypothetical protein VFO39_17795 [Candidatus Sulfotelmatobacter sp.]|nr:hypothetical protein [Candidatus Sulfotelmatobacter sp.]